MWDRAEWAGGSSERDSDPIWRCEECDLVTMDMLTVAEHEDEGHHLRSGPVPRP